MAKYRQGLPAHESKQAKELLNQIGARSMFRVERMARSGSLHPDTQVANLSVRWAKAILAAEPKYPAGASSAGRFFLSLLIEFFSLGLWGDFSFNPALGERRAIKCARLILHAAEPEEAAR